MNCGTVRKRERIDWPEWNKEHIDWSKGFNRYNKWRVDRVYDEDDLLQEAWLVFKYVSDTYPRCLCPQHMLALFKRAMTNKMNDRACRVKRRRDTPEGAISCDVYEVLAGRIGEVTNEGYLNTLLHEQPEELKLVLSMLAEGKLDEETPHKGLQVRKTASEKAREFLNKKGIYNAFSHDPVGEIKRLFA